MIIIFDSSHSIHAQRNERHGPTPVILYVPPELESIVDHLKNDIPYLRGCGRGYPGSGKTPWKFLMLAQEGEAEEPMKLLGPEHYVRPESFNLLSFDKKYESTFDLRCAQGNVHPALADYLMKAWQAQPRFKRVPQLLPEDVVDRYERAPLL